MYILIFLLQHEDISLMIFEKEIFVKLKKHFEDEGVELPMIKSMIAPNVDDKTSEVSTYTLKNYY